MRNNEKCKITEVIRKNGEIWTDLMCFLIYFEISWIRLLKHWIWGMKGKKKQEFSFEYIKDKMIVSYFYEST